MQPNLVSIIIPTYNRADLIVQTLNSIFYQTYRPLEVIVVDDGSTDDTEKTVTGWRRNSDLDFSFKYLVQNNTGAPSARNRGYIESSGELVKWLDSDDVIGQRHIECAVKTFQNNLTAGACYGPFRFFRDLDQNIYVGQKNNLSPKTGDLLAQWLRGFFIPTFSLVWRRHTIESVGLWDESLLADQDGDYIARYLAQGGNLCYCTGAWGYYRYPSPSRNTIFSEISNAKVRSRIRVIRKLKRTLSAQGHFQEHKADIAKRYAMLAHTNLQRHPLMADYCIKQTLKLAPFSLARDISRFYLKACLHTNKLLSRLIVQSRRWRMKSYSYDQDGERHPKAEHVCHSLAELCSLDNPTCISKIH